FEVRAHSAKQIVAASINNQEFVTGWIGRLHHSLYRHAIRHCASIAIHARIGRARQVGPSAAFASKRTHPPSPAEVERRAVALVELDEEKWGTASTLVIPLQV